MAAIWVCLHPTTAASETGGGGGGGSAAGCIDPAKATNQIPLGRISTCRTTTTMTVTDTSTTETTSSTVTSSTSFTATSTTTTSSITTTTVTTTSTWTAWWTKTITSSTTKTRTITVTSSSTRTSTTKTSTTRTRTVTSTDPPASTTTTITSVSTPGGSLSIGGAASTSTTFASSTISTAAFTTSSSTQITASIRSDAAQSGAFIAEAASCSMLAIEGLGGEWQRCASSVSVDDLCSGELEAGASCLPAVVPVHPCLVATEVEAHCPADNYLPGRPPSLSGRLRVACTPCGFSVGVDEDLEPGRISLRVNFGPLVIKGDIDESRVAQYHICVADEQGTVLGSPVVSVVAQPDPGYAHCCRFDKYMAVVNFSLSGEYSGGTSLHLVPAVIQTNGTSIMLPAGIELSTIKDTWVYDALPVHGDEVSGCWTLADVADQAQSLFARSAVRENITAMFAEVGGVPRASVDIDVEVLDPGQAGCGDLLQRRLQSDADLVMQATLLVLRYHLKVPEGDTVESIAARLQEYGIEIMVAEVEAALQTLRPSVRLVLKAAQPAVSTQRRYTRPALRTDCEDRPWNWTSSTGKSCIDYMVLNWCEPEGTYGVGWDFGLGLFSNYSGSLGMAANEACCGCGGGMPVGSIVDSLPFAQLTEAGCAKALPYGRKGLSAGVGSARLDTSLHAVSHSRWVQEIFTNDEEALRLEWRFPTVRTMSERFANATVGEEVTWIVFWRTHVVRKSGLWRFFDDTAETMQDKWHRELEVVPGGFVTKAIWGAFSSDSSGLGLPPDFVGLGNFGGKDLEECAIVCVPLGEKSHDCKAYESVYSLISVVVEPGTCQSFDCGEGQVMKAPDFLPRFCAGQFCNATECCVLAGSCAAISCASLGEADPAHPSLASYIPRLDAPAICPDRDCTPQECCEANLEASLDVGAASGVIGFLIMCFLALMFSIVWIVKKRRKWYPKKLLELDIEAADDPEVPEPATDVDSPTLLPDEDEDPPPLDIEPVVPLSERARTAVLNGAVLPRPKPSPRPKAPWRPVPRHMTATKPAPQAFWTMEVPPLPLSHSPRVVPRPTSSSRRPAKTPPSTPLSFRPRRSQAITPISDGTPFSRPPSRPSSAGRRRPST